MVLEFRKRFDVSLCNCGATFQGPNLKRHLQLLAAKGIEGHGEAQSIKYCAPCNEWGDIEQNFPHKKCAYVRFSKGDMLLILKRLEPLERLTLLGKAEEKNKEKVEKEKRKKDLDNAVKACLDSVPIEEEEKVEADESQDIVRRQKRVRVDLDSTLHLSLSSSESDDDFVVKRCKTTSSPKPVKGDIEVETPNVSPIPPAVFIPQVEACRVSQTLARNNLVDENCRQKKQIELLQNENFMLKAKEENRRRQELEVQKSREVMKEATEAQTKVEEENRRLLVRIRELEQANEVERQEAEAKVKSMLTEREGEKADMLNLKRCCEQLEKALSQRDDKMKKLREALEAKGKATVHLGIRQNKFINFHVENEEANDTIMCFSDEANGVRCIHIKVSGSDLNMKVRNVRWPSERKLRLHSLLFSILEL